MSNDVLLTFFKALADATRLRAVGLLAHRPHSVDELATLLDLRPSTVSHHLAKLTAAGLVTSTTEGHYHLYALDVEALQRRARRLLSSEDLRGLAATTGPNDPYDEKVLATFLDERGRIRQLPMKRKKFQVLLRHALRLFDDDGPWSEKELNSRLKTLTEDTASLRRGFIDHRLMVRNRDGSEYRKVSDGAAQT